MKRLKKLILPALVVALVASCTQPATNTADEKNGKMNEDSMKVVSYVLKKTNPKFHNTIEMGKCEVFDLQKLKRAYEVPVIFADKPNAKENNAKAFEWLTKFSKENKIAWSMVYNYSSKEQEELPWDAYWVIVLLDKDKNILGEIDFQP